MDGVKARPPVKPPSQRGNKEDDLTGVLGLYRVGEKIGRGAFGTVYKALDSESGEFVAIKRISKAQMRPKQVQRLLAEGLLMKRLSNEHIVGFRDVLDQDGYIHFILEYVDSGTLSQVIVKYGALSERLLAVYARQILLGLSYLHANGIVHRDIKYDWRDATRWCAQSFFFLSRSNNLLVSNSGVVKVADFGIAHLVEGPNDALKTLRQNKNLTGNSMEDHAADVGSPYWMSPEVIQLIEATPASDIWSFGCTCLELLTGKPPYFECSKAQACFRMVEDPHPPFPDKLSPVLTEFLLLCFKQEPRERATATQLLSHAFLESVSKPKPLSKSADAIALSHVEKPKPASVPDAPDAEKLRQSEFARALAQQQEQESSTLPVVSAAAAVDAPPNAPPVPPAATLRKGKLCYSCNEKLPFGAKECGKCRKAFCKKCLHPKKVGTIRGGKVGKSIRVCVDCLALSDTKDVIALEDKVKK